jgi:hypothetical protein
MNVYIGNGIQTAILSRKYQESAKHTKTEGYPIAKKQ